jgi:GH15 family glucan-1,4-alpha-glucosidase
MQQIVQPSIRDLALIGDKKTCALVDKKGSIVWHCLWRFDQPSLFSLLVDEKGGFWSVEAENKEFKQRRFKGDSAILVSEFTVDGGSFTATDFMPFSSEISGICRIFSPAPVSLKSRLFLKPGYGRSHAKLKKGSNPNIVHCNAFEFYIKASHPLTIYDDIVELNVLKGETSWCVLLDDKRALPAVSFENLQQALSGTEEKWRQIMSNISYEGPYKAQLYQSYKAIQLVTHEHSGGILAAATTSLPEEIGSHRNYDYRYVWLRDTAMDVSALVRASSKGNEAERFLDFLCTGRNTNKKNLFVPFYDLDNKPAPPELLLPGTGYKGSLPIRTGNGAFDQLQLDAQGNVLLAAKQVYGTKKKKPHWKTIIRTAKYLVKNWNKKDHGIWEEHIKEHYTSSKVLVAKGLEFLAEYAENEKQKENWLDAAKEIRKFVAEHCMTSDGAYAVYAGSDSVDITAALFPVWWYDAPDSAAMKQTIKRIEEEYKEGELYRRHLVMSDSKNEGVFLAACLWMAQYYLTLKNTTKAKTIIDTVLGFSTDLGFLPEEGNVRTGEPLGNIPQTFVHASLMGAILDYQDAVEDGEA